MQAASPPLRPDFPHRLLVLAALLLLYNDVLGGALRYAALQAHMLSLSYLPMVLALAAVVVHLGRGITGGPGRAAAWFLVLFFALEGAWGLLLQAPLPRVLFGFYVWVPFMAGLLLAADDSQEVGLQLLKRHAPWLWLLAVGGMLLNSVVELPWTGQEYQAGGLELQITREWTTLGIDRLAGFSRASFSAANQITLLTLMLLALPGRWWAKPALLALAVYAVVLTTSKAPLLALGVGAVALLGHEALRLAGAGGGRAYAATVVALLLAAMVALPLLPQGSGWVNEEFQWYFVQLASLADRFTLTWPAAFELLRGEHSLPVWLGGRGLGGIGAPQQLGEALLYNSADNLFLYLYVSFGAAAGLFAWLWLRPFLQRHAPADLRLLLALASGALVIGWAANGVESATVSLLLGALAGVGFRPRPTAAP